MTGVSKSRRKLRGARQGGGEGTNQDADTYETVSPGRELGRGERRLVATDVRKHQNLRRIVPPQPNLLPGEKELTTPVDVFRDRLGAERSQTDLLSPASQTRKPEIPPPFDALRMYFGRNDDWRGSQADQ